MRCIARHQRGTRGISSMGTACKILRIVGGRERTAVKTKSELGYEKNKGRGTG